MPLKRLLVLFAVTGSAAANAQSIQSPTRKLVVTLDVGSADAPKYLCVISDLAGCDKARHNTPDTCPVPLASIAPEQLTDHGDASNSPRLVYFDRGPIDGKAISKSKLPVDLLGAWSQLTHSVVQSCALSHEACRPELELPDRMFQDPQFPPRVICSNMNTSGREGNVAFVYVYFSKSSLDSGISLIELQGTNATITFFNQISAKDYLYAEVVGGSYAASARTLIGTQERLTVPLHPRCELYHAELPPHSARPIKAATIRSIGSSKSYTCNADGVDSSSFRIRVPYSDRPQLTILQMESGGSLFEASWADSLPPKPLRLAVRSLDFTWRRDCMSGKWPSTEPRPPGDTPEWSAQCPRAVISAGIPCHVRDPDTSSEICRYNCEVPSGIAPFQLPAPIQFDRMRIHDERDGRRVETVYSWNDTLHYAGEELRSFVSLPDRRILVELDPEQWRGRWAGHKGEALDEIRLVWPNGSISNVDLARNRELLQHWRAMPAPGITCSDQVRVAVFGARKYEERPFPVEGGRLELPAPEAFLCPMGRCSIPSHLWMWVGLGELVAIDERKPDVTWPSGFYLHGSVGITLELYKNLWLRPNSIEFELSEDIGHISFGTKQRDDTAEQLEDVKYTWTNVRARYIWWQHSVRHYALAAGLSLGIPLLNSDSAKIGVTWSATLEIGAMFRLLHFNGAWYEAVLGVRYGEEHRYFENYELSRQFSERPVLQLYLAARFRFRFG